jgi:hypothetical protein
MIFDPTVSGHSGNSECLMILETVKFGSIVIWEAAGTEARRTPRTRTAKSGSICLGMVASKRCGRRMGVAGTEAQIREMIAVCQEVPGTKFEA